MVCWTKFRTTSSSAKANKCDPCSFFSVPSCFKSQQRKTFVAASLIELLHTATLVHDDVVDEAMTRRGFFSINALWKNKIAVLVGDYLLSKGLLISVNNNAFDLLKIVATAVQEMSEGELLQQEKSRRMKVTEEIYYQIIRQKTASLIGACCQMGGASANVDEGTQKALYQMGIKIGIAFQIKDDLLDLGFGANIGKPTGGDIQENKLTLPIIHALQHGSKETVMFIKQLLKNKNVSQKELLVLQQQLMATGSIEYASQAMLQYAKEAENILATFPLQK